MAYNLLITDLSVNVDPQSTTTYTSTITRTLTLGTFTGVKTTAAVVVTGASKLSSTALNISLLSKRDTSVSKVGLILAIVIPIVVFTIICAVIYYAQFHSNTKLDIESSVSHDAKTLDSLSTVISSQTEKCLKPPQIVFFKPSVYAKQCLTPPLAIKHLFKRQSVVPEIVYEPSTPLQASTKPQLIAKRFSKSLPKLPSTAAIIENCVYTNHF